MIDIAEIFKNVTLDTEKLLREGVFNTESGYCKEYQIMNDRYHVSIVISVNGDADFRVYETETGEEYMPAHVYGSTGAFVGEIHTECEAILKSIAVKCCCSDHFQWEQSKRILAFIRNTYGAEPEFLWDRFPDCAALRVPGKSPWFALIGRIPMEKLHLGGNGPAEIINLKDEPERVKSRIEAGEALPAYHMNKQHWYTVILNDTIPDDKIAALIENSYALVSK